MSAFDDHKEELDHYETMMGRHRGRLAVTLDRLTNAMVLIGTNRKAMPAAWYARQSMAVR